MSKVTALALAQALSLNQVIPERLDYFFQESVYALGALPFIVEATLLPVDPLQATFSFPDEALAELAVFYHDRVLDFMSISQLTAANPYWALERGWPVAYTTDDLTERTFRLYPVPELPSDPYIPFFMDPLGRDYPAYNALLLHTRFLVDPPVHLELPLIYASLTRAFGNESTYRDPLWAEGCAKLAALLLEMLRLPEFE